MDHHEKSTNVSMCSSNEKVYNETTFATDNCDKFSLTRLYRNAKVTRKKKWKYYRKEMKSTLPYRFVKCHKEKLTNHVVQMDKLNCFQYVFFIWMTPLIRKIFKQKLNYEDLGTCSPLDSCSLNSSRLNIFWKEQYNKSGLHNASLNWTMFKFLKTRFFMATLFYVLCLVTGYLSSKLLEEIESILKVGIMDINTTNEFNKTINVNYGIKNISSAFKWTAALYFCEFLRATSFSVMFAISIRTGIRCVNALNGIIYQKIMTRIPYLSENSFSSIQPNNLFSNDSWKVFQMIYMAPLMIGSPIIIIVTVIYTYLLIGTLAFYGIALFIIIFLLQFLITKRQMVLRNHIMKQMDHRISLINQLVKYIRAIKFYAWESPFQNEIQYCRSTECSIIKKYQYLQCLSTSLALLTPMLITIINILVHTWLGNNLTVSTAFSLFMLNYIAAHGVRSLPNYFRDIVNGQIALKRVEKFLQMDDYKSYITTEMIDDRNAIEIVNCSFFWFFSSEQHPISLLNITLLVEKKSHICLYGPIGSGKTAILLSIMGQTQCSEGKVRLFSKKIAYVSQKAWLQNSTIRDNILFGLPFDRKRYYETLMKCSLTEDISLLANGEDTIVGENGVKLSGGQKQRIALARAVYADSDIYLIDDCFSSFDTRVLKAIFNNIIKDILKYKTVIFVTRHLYLLDAKDIVAIINDGKIQTLEKHSKLLENSEEYRNSVEQSKVISRDEKQTNLPELYVDDEDNYNDTVSEFDVKSIDKTYKETWKNDTKQSSNSYNSLITLMIQYDDYFNNNEDIDTNGENLSQDYNRLKRVENGGSFNKKSVSWSVYSNYIQSSGGRFIFSIMIIVFIVQTATSTFSNWWLSYWLNQGSGSQNNGTINGESSIIENPNLRFYQLIYLVLFMIVIVTSLTMGAVFVRVITRAANNLHNKVLAKVVYSPIIFFDSIKMGKIINLFSHNIDDLDNQLPVVLDGFLQRILLIIGNLIIIISMLYWFVLPFLCFTLAFYLVFRYYRKAMYWLKQVDMRLRSPIYGYITSTIDGLAIIKAFGVEKKFQNYFYSLCDQQVAANYYYHCAIRWLSIRIDFICLMASLVVTIFIIFNLTFVGSAYAGLLITQSLQLSGLLQLVIRLGLELETRLVSVERISTYTCLIKKEKSIIGKKLSFKDLNEWPNEKRISFRQVSLRYRNNSPLVLDSVSFDVKGGQKFAIIGRTGAGKSSITYALFRLVEICSGAITIDNINIQSIPLRILRSKLSIIPQDPVVFQKSVRKNLDPLLKSKDDELMKVLEEVKLSDKIAAFKNGLDEIVSEEKFSTGEKQLLCLARTLLYDNKIIVLDEATSSVDDQTEKDIWEIVQNKFKDCSIILIAHRLQTVLKCDQLIVLQNGKVIEHGNPIELQKDRNSHFFKIISRA